MTAKQSVIELLKQQQQLETAGQIVEPEAVREEWLKALAELMNRLRAWMAEAEADHLLRVEPIEVGLNEERIGSYYAPGLKVVTPADVTVRITPRARLVVGGLGRVDLECSPKKAILVRKEASRWQVAVLVPEQGGWTFEEFNEDSFWETLRDLF